MFSTPILTPHLLSRVLLLVLTPTSRKSQEGVNASSSFVLRHSKAVMDSVTAQPTNKRYRRIGEMKTDLKEMESVVREVLGEHLLKWWHFFY